MSLRRFAGYFMALTALATVAFASSVMGQAPPQTTADMEAAREARCEQEIQDRTAYLMQQMRARHPHSSHGRILLTRFTN